MNALDVVIENRAKRYGIDRARVARMYDELSRGGRSRAHFVHHGDTLLHVIAEHSYDMLHEIALIELSDPDERAAWIAEYIEANESPFFRVLQIDGTLGDVARDGYGKYLAAAWPPVTSLRRAIVALDAEAGEEQWPEPGETREHFTDRCVAGLMAGGMGDAKAHEVCAAKWRDAHKMFARDWDESKHPRVPAGSPEGGQFGEGGGEGEREHPGEGYSKDAWVDADGAIHTSNVHDAQRALFENRKVVLKQPKQVSTLIHELAKTINRYRESGEAAPLLDLCNVSVEGTNLFCAETKGIPRVEMPQMDTKTTKRFVEYLKGKGYEVEKRRERASHLRATQNQLSAEKVIVNLERNKDEPERLEKRLVVSRDNYILDGHHHWAAKLALDAEDNKLTDDTKMRVSRVDIDIITLLDEAEKFTGGKGKKGAEEKDWDESKHPRVPAGSPEGGQFGEGGGGDGEAEPSLSAEVISVGGDAWNRAVARNLERDYQNARPAIAKLEAQAVGEQVAAPPPDEDEGEPPFEPEEWDMISSSGQDMAKQKWMEQNESSYYDSEVENYFNEQAFDDARRDVVYEFNKDKSNEKNQWAMDALNEMEQRFPFGNHEILDAITIDEGVGDTGSGSGSYWEKYFKIDFDDEKLNAAGKAHREGEGEELPMGQEPPDYSKLLTDKMREDITEALKEAFGERVDEVAPDLEAPEYLKESVAEYLESGFDEMSDKQKFEWTKQNTDIVQDETTEGTGSYASETPPSEALDKLPSKYDPLNLTEGEDYRRTQKLARLLSVQRARQLIVERMNEKLPKGEPPVALGAVGSAEVAAIDSKLWAAWKGSSTAPDGILLQLATAEELGGRLNVKTGSVKGEQIIFPDKVRARADNVYANIGGYDGVKAYVRAKWETSQYLLDKAGLNTLQVYRGIRLATDKYNEYKESAQLVKAVGRDHWKLPFIHVDRNGAASTSVKASVSNEWDGDTAVVLRAEVPRTAAVSIPAYGINVHSEREVVVAGTAWKAWDAWAGPAPEFQDHPIGPNGSGIGDNAPLIKEAA